MSGAHLNVLQISMIKPHIGQHANPDDLPLWHLAGPVSVIEGHYAILPVNIQHDGKSLCATDSLPCCGQRSRAHAINSLTQLARTLHVQHDYTAHTLSEALPINQWDHTAMLRHRIQNIARQLCPVASIRVADKGRTMLFAFCRQWHWDQTEQFLVSEKYHAQHLHENTCIQQSLRHIMHKNK